MNHFKKLPRSWSTELNLRYEFSSRKIPNNWQHEKAGKNGKTSKWMWTPVFPANNHLTSEQIYSSVYGGVECSPTENLKKIARLHFFN